MTHSLMPLLAFVLVIALIPLALWTMKRAGVGGAPAGNVLRQVAQLGLGASQRVAVVEVAVGHVRQPFENRRVSVAREHRHYISKE